MDWEKLWGCLESMGLGHGGAAGVRLPWSRCGPASAQRRMGRLGSKTLGMYLLTTALAVSLALTPLIGSRGTARPRRPAEIDYQPKPAPSVKEPRSTSSPPTGGAWPKAMLQVIVFRAAVRASPTKTANPANASRRLDDVNETR